MVFGNLFNQKQPGFETKATFFGGRTKNHLLALQPHSFGKGGFLFHDCYVFVGFPRPKMVSGFSCLGLASGGTRGGSNWWGGGAEHMYIYIYIYTTYIYIYFIVV